jgi:hypothetical protein
VGGRLDQETAAAKGHLVSVSPRFLDSVENTEREERGRGAPPVAARTVEVDLPADATLDQAIVALLKLRRGEVPGDASLEHAAVLTFEYTTSKRANPAVSSQELTPEE